MTYVTQVGKRKGKLQFISKCTSKEKLAATPIRNLTFLIHEFLY